MATLTLGWRPLHWDGDPDIGTATPAQVVDYKGVRGSRKFVPFSEYSMFRFGNGHSAYFNADILQGFRRHLDLELETSLGYFYTDIFRRWGVFLMPKVANECPPHACHKCSRDSCALHRQTHAACMAQADKGLCTLAGVVLTLVAMHQGYDACRALQGLACTPAGMTQMLPRCMRAQVAAGGQGAAALPLRPA
jgi:hypothetical protein